MNDDGISTKTHGERDDIGIVSWETKTAVNLESVLSNDHGSLEHHQIESSRSLTTLCGGTNIATEAWLSYIFRTLPTNLPRSHQTKVKTSFTTPPFLQVLREFSDFSVAKLQVWTAWFIEFSKCPHKKKRKKKTKKKGKTHSSSSEFPAREKTRYQTPRSQSCAGKLMSWLIAWAFYRKSLDMWYFPNPQRQWAVEAKVRVGILEMPGETMYISLHLPYKSAKYR